MQNEQTQKQIRDAAWQELVDKYLFIKNAKAAGITVGEDEITDRKRRMLNREAESLGLSETRVRELESSIKID